MSSLTDLILTDNLHPPHNFDDMFDDVDIDIDPPYQLFSSNFFQALSDNALCPFLKNVTLDQCTIDHLDDVVAFALARTTIRSLNVSFQSMDPSFRFSDEQVHVNKRNLLKERGINAEWHSGWDVGRRPVVMDNSLSSAGLPLLFNGVY
ncbi:hypothetical protein VNI00_013825 [Paramarasmius palmivorus]|uniref:Uncharacterized protein n=1 Tax=Paramarasmius palmivorus TaxID=297713 RepID=A0AAW0C0B6_9AGAR